MANLKWQTKVNIIPLQFPKVIIECPKTKTTTKTKTKKSFMTCTQARLIKIQFFCLFYLNYNLKTRYFALLALLSSL